VIREYYERYNHKDFFFVEIGAYDGIAADPAREFILKYKWKGILIEPIPYIFETLKKNYEGHQQLIFENIAISNDDNDRIIYYSTPEFQATVSSKKWPIQRRMLTAISSFQQDTWLNVKRSKREIKWFRNEIIPNMVALKVPCMSLQSFFDKHGIKELDLLQIDTEGFDYEIIKQIDKIRPRLINYENKHLADKKQKCVQFLESIGYKITITGGNTIAERIHK